MSRMAIPGKRMIHKYSNLKHSVNKRVAHTNGKMVSSMTKLRLAYCEYSKREELTSYSYGAKPISKKKFGHTGLSDEDSYSVFNGMNLVDLK